MECRSPLGNSNSLYRRDTPFNSSQQGEHQWFVLQVSDFSHFHRVCDRFSSRKMGSFFPRCPDPDAPTPQSHCIQWRRPGDKHRTIAPHSAANLGHPVLRLLPSHHPDTLAFDDPRPSDGDARSRRLVDEDVLRRCPKHKWGGDRHHSHADCRDIHDVHLDVGYRSHGARRHAQAGRVH